MGGIIILIVLAIQGCAQVPARGEGLDRTKTNCDALLEQSGYDITNDSRTELALRSVALAHGDDCPKAFRDLGNHLSRHLKFREAAEMMRNYVKRVGAKDAGYDDKDVLDLESAADLQERIKNSQKPQLNDLLEFTLKVRAYGKNHSDAIPYAERAVALYPDSVPAILNLVGVLPRRVIEKDRVERLLSSAATIEPASAQIYSTRGWWNLRIFRKHSDAERDFRQALSTSNDTDPLAWKGLGYLFMERGQKHDAVAAFRKYVNLHKGPIEDEIVRFIESVEPKSQ